MCTVRSDIGSELRNCIESGFQRPGRRYRPAAGFIFDSAASKPISRASARCCRSVTSPATPAAPRRCRGRQSALFKRPRHPSRRWWSCWRGLSSDNGTASHCSAGNWLQACTILPPLDCPPRQARSIRNSTKNTETQDAHDTGKRFPRGGPLVNAATSVPRQPAPRGPTTYKAPLQSAPRQARPRFIMRSRVTTPASGRLWCVRKSFTSRDRRWKLSIILPDIGINCNHDRHHHRGPPKSAARIGRAAVPHIATSCRGTASDRGLRFAGGIPTGRFLARPGVYSPPAVDPPIHTCHAVTARDRQEGQHEQSA